MAKKTMKKKSVRKVSSKKKVTKKPVARKTSTKTKKSPSKKASKVSAKSIPVSHMKQPSKKMTSVSFKEAFEYAFNRPVGLLNILWILIPIYGWFLLMGYSVRIVQEFIDGKFKQLPLVDHPHDFSLGFVSVIKLIPVMLFFMVVSLFFSKDVVFTGVWEILMMIFLPILIVHFYDKFTVKSSFDFDILKSVFSNFAEFVIMWLKTLLLIVALLPLCIVIVGIPAIIFTQNIFLADFYRRFTKK